MKLTVTGRRLAVTPATRQDIATKMRRLERVLGDSAVSAQIVLSLDARTFVCELTVHARGDHMLHGVGRHARQTTAVAAAVEKVDQQARKLKGRWKTRRRSAQPPAPAPVAEPAAASAAPATRAGASPRRPRVRRQRLQRSKPMTLDDAILALEDAASPVLVFRQPESDALQILHRGDDGQLVLIEPEG